MMEMRENKAVRHMKINSKIVSLSLVATLNVNGLNIPFKRQRLAEKQENNQDPAYDVL